MSEFWEVMGWPFAACLVLTGIHVYLGIHVVARKVIFVDLALAQIAALGTAAGIVVGGYDADHDPWMLFAYSFAFSCMGALILTVTRTRGDRVPHEAVIGIVYAVAFAAAIVLLSKSPMGFEEVRRNLEGNILWVTPRKVGITAAMYAVVGIVHVLMRRPFLALSFEPQTVPSSRVAWLDFLFYLTFGFVITSSVAMAGVFLVFSYLVIPSVGAMLLADRIRTRLLIGWAGAAAISLAGCYASYRHSLPTSPLIVVMLGAVLAAAGIARRIATSEDRARTLMRMGGVAGVLALFAAALVALSKPEEEPFDRAVHLMHGGGELTAMEEFARHPQRRAEWLPLVREAAHSGNPQVRGKALELLGLDEVVAKLASADAGVREDALSELRRLGDPGAAAPLMEAAAREPEIDLRIEMYETAMALGEAGAIAPLIGLMEDASVEAYLRHDVEDHLLGHLPVGGPAEIRPWFDAHRGRLRYVDGRFVAD